ncbi:hypothetical protein BUM88_06060 [Acinetobacter calcoaceticus]|uniref:hypothetical protein n=1 Tax=Acinetobacter calcoaceticus TaxID=471 RepID=UPI0009AD7EC0|nr:hypothetical protein [Acinetobacter calcoaceticus]AQZ81203.1 hypothetical protein BUM88_06060 [Acinetobacter calcoaceticus]
MSLKITSDFSGLKKLTENAKKLNGEQQVSLGTLFNEGFLQANTDFENIDELFEKAGFKVETEEDFAAIPQEDIDTFVRENTKFESFTDMQQHAATEYMRKQLFKGLK